MDTQDLVDLEQRLESFIMSLDAMRDPSGDDMGQFKEGSRIKAFELARDAETLLNEHSIEISREEQIERADEQERSKWGVPEFDPDDESGDEGDCPEPPQESIRELRLPEFKIEHFPRRLDEVIDHLQGCLNEVKEALAQRDGNDKAAH